MLVTIYGNGSFLIIYNYKTHDKRIYRVFVYRFWCVSGPGRVGMLPYQRKGKALLGSASLRYTHGHGV